MGRDWKRDGHYEFDKTKDKERWIDRLKLTQSIKKKKKERKIRCFILKMK